MENKLLEKLKEELSIDELKEMSKDVNGYDGRLDFLDYYENDEYFFQDFFQHKVDDAVRAVCYGNYEYMDDYVRFNAYGNLDSCSEYEYEKEIEEYADEIIEDYVEIIDEMWNDDLVKKIKNIIKEDENEAIN